MKHFGPISVILIVVCVFSALAVVASRGWLTQSNRTLHQTERQLAQLLKEERALHLEMTARSDLNTLERQAVEKMGMRPPRPDQWVIVEP